MGLGANVVLLFCIETEVNWIPHAHLVALTKGMVTTRHAANGRPGWCFLQVALCKAVAIIIGLMCRLFAVLARCFVIQDMISVR